MYRHNYLTLSAALLALTTLASCDDKDFGYTAADIRAAAYSSHFTDLFGEVDPNHDWSMAKAVHVNLNIPNAAGYRLRILTEAPTNRETTLLYECILNSDQFSVNVDVVRGTRSIYVEIKSGVDSYLVDGYYYIDEEGNVEVNRMATRTLSSAPTCSQYTGTLYRWDRTWDKNVTSPSDNDYKYDYGFVLNRRKDFLASGDENNITPGWSINCDDTEGGLRTHQNTAYSGGPRVLQMTSSHVDGLDNMSVTKAFYFRNLAVDNNTSNPHGAFSKSYICFGDDPNYPLHIGDQDITIHVPLASRNSGELSFRLTLDRRDGDTWTEIKTQDVTVETAYATSSETQNGVLFKDVTLNFNAGWAGGNFRLKVQILTVGWKQAFCAGYIIEQKGPHPSFSEQAVNGTVKYSDVRGGGVYTWGDNKLFEGNTKRDNGGNTEFKYRTYDTREMTYSNGENGFAGGYISNFHIIDGNIVDRTENIKYRDMFPLYGMYKSTDDNKWKGSPFHEGDNHIDDFFTDPGFHNAKWDMPHDAQIVTWGECTDANGVHHDGSVEAKLVGIGTGWSNDVGYFFYPKSDEALMVTHQNGEKVLDFNKVPKVVIRRNMQNALVGDQPNAGNIAEDGKSMSHYGLGSEQYNRFVNGCAALSLTKAERAELLTAGNFNRDKVPEMIESLENNSVKTAAAIEATFEAPVYKLPFYPITKDGGGVYQITGQPTFEWPEDYVIGFFGIRTDDHTACELARIYTSSASVQRNYFNDLPRGSAFTYKGKTYIGLEDEWDYDNNDFLFELQGVKPVNPDITPNDDPVPDPNRSQDWIIACEDLGGVWDYDFNDLVWAISKEVKSSSTKTTTDIYFTALAAGGTLEAIVEYNTSLALGPGDTGWDENKWVEVGEIHNLVKRTTAKQNGDYVTDVHTQLNVDKNHHPSRNDIGERIKLGETISSTIGDPNNIDIASILKHFRIKVIGGSGEYIVVNRQQHDNHNHHDVHTSLDYTDGKTNAPQFILLPPGWAWPAEAVCINKVYEINDWFENAETDEWYNTWRYAPHRGGDFIFNPLDTH